MPDRSPAREEPPAPLAVRSEVFTMWKTDAALSTLLDRPPEPRGSAAPYRHFEEDNWEAE